MMQRLADDPQFWVAIVALISALAAYFKAKANDVETRTTDKRLDQVSATTGSVREQVNVHSAQLALLQAQVAAPAPSAPVATAPAPVAAPVAAPETAVTPAPLTADG
jgi:hypothetical protein